MPAQGIITLTTDFGLTDGYVGALKGVILGINPEVSVVDISHQVRPQDIREGAYVLYSAYRYFPPKTIHVIVVDPGVGSARRSVAVETPRALFVAPDNGVLSYVLSAEAEEGFGETEELRAVHLTNAEYWVPAVSNTFHGRDIFAPVAAHLSRGVALDRFGTATQEVHTFPISRPIWVGDGSLVGRVIYVDRFGNAITDIKERHLELLPGPVALKVAGQVILGLSSAYASVPDGELLALLGSAGHLEISLRNGSAAEALDLETGDEVVVRTASTVQSIPSPSSAEEKP